MNLLFFVIMNKSEYVYRFTFVALQQIIAQNQPKSTEFVWSCDPITQDYEQRNCLVNARLQG